MLKLNPNLCKLQPYPFEKLRCLFDGVSGNPAFREIRLSIGEPRHPTPAFIREALSSSLDGLAIYPATAGSPALRQAIAAWLQRRYGLTGIDPETQILPTAGSREALFSLTQTMIDPSGSAAPLVVCPNPFYQIYEGAAYLAGAEPRFLNTLPENDFAFDFDALSSAEWNRVQLLFVCSPANPTGKVLRLSDWEKLFALADHYGFAIASDECYSEIFFDETRPPIGCLQAAQKLGRGFDRLVMLSSLSKRSNVPGLRSGFAAGDPAILKDFLLYRTYHGCAMSPSVQAASIAAWGDETHVVENRTSYRAKFDAVMPVLSSALETSMPDAGFYFWARVRRRTSLSDTEFARRLFSDYNLIVLPGCFLARTEKDVNPGEGFLRIALVAPLVECVEAADRIRQFVFNLE